MLPGTNPTPRLQSDPRGVITDILDLYARAKFADLPHFRVTQARLGLYRSEEHIDNPHGLETSTFPGFDRKPTAQQVAIDPVHQRANYIAGRLNRPAKSAVEYMREELAAAVREGPTPEGRRRFGQALHVLEDFYAHSNFCELALRSVGKTSVEPWTVSVTAGGRTFFPLVTGCFGGIDTAASILLALGEIMEEDMNQPCAAGKRTLGVSIALILLRDLRPHLGKQADALLGDFETLQRDHPIIANLMCNTVGKVMRFFHALIGMAIRLLANQIDEYQAFAQAASLNPTHSQLAKDHDDHPLHVLAADCAKVAVKDIGRLMKLAWDGPLPADRTRQIQDKAESYFVHPDFIVGPGSSPELLEIMSQVRSFADNPANASAIVRASTRNVLDDHLRELQDYGNKVTKSIPIDRIKQMFGL